MQGDSESLFVEYDERKKAGESHKEAFAAAEATVQRVVALAGDEGFNLVATVEAASEALLEEILADVAEKEIDSACADMMESMLAQEFRAA